METFNTLINNCYRLESKKINMSSHTCSIFTNSCIKQPVNPSSQQPVPHYERPLSTLNNRMRFLNIKDMKDKNKNNFYCSDSTDICNLRSLIDFYDSIPDYHDINHLTENEFYSKLKMLKDMCSRLKRNSASLSSLNNSTCSRDKNLNYRPKSLIISNKPSSKSSALKTDLPLKSEVSLIEKPIPIVKNPDPPSRIRSAQRKFVRSKSVSPLRSSSSVTIPKPFKMTQREQEEKLLDDLYFRDRCSSLNSKIKAKEKKFKANPVPLTSRIPLFNQIMEEQKLKSQLAKLNSSLELQSKMKTFNFTERTHSRCPSDLLEKEKMLNRNSTFKARPCPKNLFSNYFYNKLWEDEYFKAEELLKQSSLPPSMAQREKNFKISPAPTSNSSVGKFKKRKSKKSQKNIRKAKISSFLSPVPINDSAKSKSNNSDNSTLYGFSPSPIYPVARPNLAATLRAEVVKKKVKPSLDCYERNYPRMDWGVRKTAAWKSLGLIETHDEDLSLRLATRKAEQRLRDEEYETSMSLMRERVRAAPLLLEGNTFWGPKVGQVSHDCGKECRLYFHKLKKKKCRKDVDHQKGTPNSVNSHTNNSYTKWFSKGCKFIKQHHTDSDDLASEDRAYL